MISYASFKMTRLPWRPEASERDSVSSFPSPGCLYISLASLHCVHLWISQGTSPTCRQSAFCFLQAGVSVASESAPRAAGRRLARLDPTLAGRWRRRSLWMCSRCINNEHPTALSLCALSVNACHREGSRDSSADPEPRVNGNH